MTPKQKAEELLAKMDVKHYMKFGKPESKGLPISMYRDQVKVCALIAVDSVIEETKHYQDLVSVWQDSNGTQTVIDRVKYWQEVKNHLKEM